MSPDAAGNRQPETGAPMPNEEFPPNPNPPDVADGRDNETDAGVPPDDAEDPLPSLEHAVPLLTYRQSRAAMQLVVVVLGLAALISLAYFGYSAYRRWSTGGVYVPTTVALSTVVGHLLRGVGLGMLCASVIKYARCIDVATGKLSGDFAVRHRSLWRTSALILALLGAYTGFEALYASRQENYEFFRPEFQSGFVLLKPERFEFRRGSEAPVDGWLRQRVGDTEREIFVAPAAEITGNDIRQVAVRVAEIFPGSQTVEVHIRFTEEGARKMELFTKANLTQPLAVLFDGELRAAPRIFSPITGDAQLGNVFTVEEAVRMIQAEPNR